MVFSKEEDTMNYKSYSAEYKLTIVDEYLSRDISIRKYADEKNIPVRTFYSWLQKVRSNRNQPIRKDNLAPIDITNETKAMIKDSPSSHFTMKIKGITFSFSIDDLNKVLEAIRYG